MRRKCPICFCFCVFMSSSYGNDFPMIFIGMHLVVFPQPCQVRTVNPLVEKGVKHFWKKFIKLKKKMPIYRNANLFTKQISQSWMVIKYVTVINIRRYNVGSVIKVTKITEVTKLKIKLWVYHWVRYYFISPWHVP